MEMDQAEFNLKVQLLARPEDFEEHKYLLENIDKERYKDYLNCLKYGAKMFPAFKALEKLIIVSKETGLPIEDLFRVHSFFRSVTSVFNTKN